MDNTTVEQEKKKTYSNKEPLFFAETLYKCRQAAI